MEEWEKCLSNCPFFETHHHCVRNKCGFFQERTRSWIEAAAGEYPEVAEVAEVLLQKDKISNKDFEQFLNVLAQALSKVEFEFRT